MGTAAELLSLSASDVCGSETENRGSESGKRHCSSKGTFVLLAGHYCATSRHFVYIRFKKESMTQIPFTLHLSLEIPCVYRGSRG